MRTALHVTLTPLVFYFLAVVVTVPLGNSAATGLLALAALPLGVWYGWRNRHR